VFLAPTKPLVEQQLATCVGIPAEHCAMLTGSTSKSDARQAMWEAKRVVFCTPQARGVAEGGRKG